MSIIIPAKKVPTASAITTAARNGEKCFEQGYEAYQSKSVPHQWFAIKPNTNRHAYYRVDTLRGTCECEFFKAEGVCKHQKFIADYIRYEQMIADYEEEESWRDFASLRDEVEFTYPEPEPDEDMETRVCLYHGPHADNLPYCPRCEKLCY